MIRALVSRKTQPKRPFLHMTSLESSEDMANSFRRHIIGIVDRILRSSPPWLNQMDHDVSHVGNGWFGQ